MNGNFALVKAYVSKDWTQSVCNHLEEVYTNAVVQSSLVSSDNIICTHRNSHIHIVDKEIETLCLLYGFLFYSV
ncbi:hypothetical protein CHH53_14500 [Terribacillus sp. 7520-G]|nr:hypothetical protein CHH53_14500 [Terribacillus sp. 7520-G]